LLLLLLWLSWFVIAVGENYRLWHNNCAAVDPHGPVRYDDRRFIDFAIYLIIFVLLFLLLSILPEFTNYVDAKLNPITCANQ